MVMSPRGCFVSEATQVAVKTAKTRQSWIIYRQLPSRALFLPQDHLINFNVTDDRIHYITEGIIVVLYIFDWPSEKCILQNIGVFGIQNIQYCQFQWHAASTIFTCLSEMHVYGYSLIMEVYRQSILSEVITKMSLNVPGMTCNIIPCILSWLKIVRKLDITFIFIYFILFATLILTDNVQGQISCPIDVNWIFLFLLIN